MRDRRPHTKNTLTSRNWFGKASAGLILGFLLSLALGGAVGRFAFGGVGRFSIEHQLTMWLIAPVWLAILSGCFLFLTGLRAWLWLGAANLALWSLLIATG